MKCERSYFDVLPEIKLKEMKYSRETFSMFFSNVQTYELT
jgi:hypothetical protein